MRRECIGDDTGGIVGIAKGDTRSLDYESFKLKETLLAASRN